MKRFQISPTSHLNGLLALFGVFLVYYYVANAERVWQSPRLVEQVHGSLAQFTLPFGVALGVFQALSLRPLGIHHLFLTATASAFAWRVWVAFKAFCVLAAMITTNGLALVALNVVGGVPPLLRAAYFIYPISFLLLGISIGVFVGPLLDWAFRPQTRVVAYLLSISFGVVTFLGAVVGSGIVNEPRYSLSLGAEVVESFEKIRDTPLLLQSSLAIDVGLILLLFSIVATRLPVRLRFSCVAIAVAGSVLAALVIQQLRADGSSSALRPQSDAFCAGSDVLVCAWEEERRGVALLLKKIDDNPQIVGLRTFPDGIVQQGVKSPSANYATVASMPNDSASAEGYLAEMVLRGNGCTDADIGANQQVFLLLDYLAKQIAESGPVDPSRLDALKVCS